MGLEQVDFGMDSDLRDLVNTTRFIYAKGVTGNGENLLFIVPENLVVSFTSSAYGQGYGHQRAHNISSTC